MLGAAPSGEPYERRGTRLTGSRRERTNRGVGARTGFAVPGDHARDGRVGSLGVHRLEQIVDRVYSEGANRVRVARDDEDDRGKHVVIEGGDHLKAVQLRHLNVKKDEIRTLFDDEIERAAAVAGFTAELETIIATYEVGDTLSGKRLVVNDERAQPHRASSSRLAS